MAAPCRQGCALRCTRTCTNAEVPHRRFDVRAQCLCSRRVSDTALTQEGPALCPCVEDGKRLIATDQTSRTAPTKQHKDASQLRQAMIRPRHGLWGRLMQADWLHHAPAAICAQPPLLLKLLLVQLNDSCLRVFITTRSDTHCPSPLSFSLYPACSNRSCFPYRAAWWAVRCSNFVSPLPSTPRFSMVIYTRPPAMQGPQRGEWRLQAKQDTPKSSLLPIVRFDIVDPNVTKDIVHHAATNLESTELASACGCTLHPHASIRWLAAARCPPPISRSSQQGRPCGRRGLPCPAAWQSCGPMPRSPCQTRRCPGRSEPLWRRLCERSRLSI